MRVSVVMATFNGEKFLREQLDSILAQTYPIYEIIINDDCSTDSTAEIIREYSSKTDIIKFSVNENNLGFNENFKKAAMLSLGDYVAFSDQDDIWFQDKIAVLMKNIGDCAMCYSPHLRGTDINNSHVVTYKCAPERQLFDPIVGHSMLLQGDFVRDQKNWMPGISYDYSMSINAHLYGGVTIVNKPLVFHRIHDNEVTYPGNQVILKPWTPYLHGLEFYKKNQKSCNYSEYFSSIMERSIGKNDLVSEICRLMLSCKLKDIFHLCIICMNKHMTVYPNKSNRIRGFFHPFIYSTYHTWK